MNNINKTLYIPLYGKNYVSKKGLFIKDTKAEEIWAKEGFLLKGKSKSKWLAYYMGIRSAVFDEWLKENISTYPNSTIIHLGCGLDSRVLRVDYKNCTWFDIDFPTVIEERKKYYTETDTYKMISTDIRDKNYLSNICNSNSKFAIVVMEGVSMYLTTDEMKNLIDNLCANFENVVLLVDCYSTFASKISKYKNPINDVGVSKVYGIDNPKEYERDNFTFVKEHTITPKKLINELKGFEKFIFSKLYAGKFAKKLYRLFEYKKI